MTGVLCLTGRRVTVGTGGRPTQTLATPPDPLAQRATANSKVRVDAFMDHLWQLTLPNHLGPARSRIFRDALLEVVPASGGVELMLVFALDKGRGAGTEAMRFLCALADRHGVAIALHPKRVGKEGIPTPKLPAFYRRFGFKSNARRQMVREPNKETRMNEAQQLREALTAIAQALDVRRNRFGKLEPLGGQAAAIGRLAVAYKIGGCEDVAEQCMKVARAALAGKEQETK